MFWLAIVLLMSSSYISGPGWEHVGYIPPFSTVWVRDGYTAHTPENEKKLMSIAQNVKQSVIGQSEEAFFVDFFDNRKMTPKALPYSNEQKNYWQARITFTHDGEKNLNWNPNGKKKSQS